MNRSGYKLLGFVVWRGGKWYLRRRVHTPQRIGAAALGGLTLAAGLTRMARRHHGPSPVGVDA